MVELEDGKTYEVYIERSNGDWERGHQMNSERASAKYDDAVTASASYVEVKCLEDSEIKHSHGTKSA